jgi:hypothetical protein
MPAYNMVSYVKDVPRNDMVLKVLHSKDFKRGHFYGFSDAAGQGTTAAKSVKEIAE